MVLGTISLHDEIKIMQSVKKVDARLNTKVIHQIYSLTQVIHQQNIKPVLIQTEKNNAPGAQLSRETGVSRQHGDSPETPQTSQHMLPRVSRGALN